LEMVYSRQLLLVTTTLNLFYCKYEKWETWQYI
jgi:hypothetical protein